MGCSANSVDTKDPTSHPTMDIPATSEVFEDSKLKGHKIDSNGNGPNTCVQNSQKQDTVHQKLRFLQFVLNWEMLIMFLTVAPMAGFIIFQPYQQTRRAELNCGPVCQGSMTSTSSFLGLIGAPLVGALSDQKGRRFALMLGCLSGAASFLVLILSNSLVGLWIALIPTALLSHNFTITKAVVADLANPEDRAGVLGKLGLAVGLGFMVGPVVHPFLSTYTQAGVIAMVLQLVSLLAIWKLPIKESEPRQEATNNIPRSLFLGVLTTVWETIKEVFVLAFAAPAAAKVILCLRFGLSMGFHVFFTVMSVILKDKFKFSAQDYSNYFAFVGLVYAVSQLLSKRLINACSSDTTHLVAACTFFLMLGRLLTATTENVWTLYCALTLSIGALGVLNNAINTTVTLISGADRVGGLMGVLDTAEKLAGVAGPAAGGFLYAFNEKAPVAAVTVGYLAMMVGVLAAFPRFVVPVARASAAKLPAKVD